jgi:hypothetical protein
MECVLWMRQRLKVQLLGAPRPAEEDPGVLHMTREEAVEYREREARRDELLRRDRDYD